jgi:hypothetical protein
MPEPRDTNDSPTCGARVDYHGGTCGKSVGHDEPCTPVVEPDPRCVRGLPAGNCCERYDTCEPVVEPEPCRYTQPDGTRCTRPGEPKHGMCGPHYWARDDEGHAPVVEPSPVCGARVDYHGGTCGKPVGHDEPCTPVVEPEAVCEGCPDPGLPCAGCPVVEPERMPCGHSRAAIVSSGEGTSYCGECVEVCSPDDYETGPEPKECPRCHVPWFGVCKACGIDMRKPEPVTCDEAMIAAGFDRKVSATPADSTTNPVEPGCDGHCAPDECVCPGLAKLAVLAERARIVGDHQPRDR